MKVCMRITSRDEAYRNRGDLPVDPMTPPESPLWHRFEVVDWQMLHDKEGTYMKIGEPFVLR